jgi:molecular chaperone HtpG
MQTHRFEAEVDQILELVIHSLYAHKEIFLRELVSNASDALDKLRFEALKRPELLTEGEVLGIAIETDAKARTLRVADNGIGMTEEELVENLGRIASSGTRRFLEQLAKRGSESVPELIGRFGVGFYSAFMVADEIVVETRKAGESEGWRWTSSGQGGYTIESAENLSRGTVVTLHLREPDETAEGEKEDFLSEWRIREIVREYSDFVEYPIQMEVERSEVPRDEQGKPIEGAKPETVRRVETLNSRKPLWARPKEQIEKKEYDEFYHHLTHDWGEPLEVIHFKAEGSLDYTALLYLPKERGIEMFDPNMTHSRLSLYVRRVLIMRECEDLLPGWLRFVRGVVESADLPLNVSRETLQASHKVRQIKKRLVKKVLEALADLCERDRSAYEGFWSSFGPILKEGIYHGEDEDGRLARLLLFRSSKQEGWTTLSEYVDRMPVAQKEIYTLVGTDRATIERSPHLEALRGKGTEVLLLTDAVDEWMLQRFREFESRPLRSIEKGDLELDAEDQKRSREEKQKEYKDLLDALQKVLDEQVREVRFSTRLKESAAVLVSDAQSPSAHMERILRHGGADLPVRKRVLELNPEHPLLHGLKRLFDVDARSPRLEEYAVLLFGQALLAEGSPLPDPARFSKLVADLMVASVSRA